MLASNYNFKKTYKFKPYHDWTMVQNMLASQEERCLTCTQAPCQTQDEAKRVKQRNCLKLEARSQLSALKGVEGCAEAPGWDQEEDKLYLIIWTYIQPITSWLVHFLEHPWCQDESRATLDSQDSLRPKLGGSHHLPPYSIFCITPPHLHLHGTFSRDSQGGISKLFRDFVDSLTR